MGMMSPAASIYCISREKISVPRRKPSPILVALVLLLLLILNPVGLRAQEPQKTYKTKYATITYPTEKSLHTFTRNTAKGFSFLRESPEKNPLLVKAQVDRIVEMVFALLDMHPPNLNFNINLYQTQAEVTTAYLRASSTNAYSAQSASGSAPIAFYFHSNRSVYVAVDNITDYILAHEIGHAVISAYFPTPPPHRMQEILCQYLDKHFR